MSSEITEKTSVDLPLTVIKSKVKSPKNLIIISKPKVGKTTLLAALPNCLLLDFENGSDYVDAMKINVESIAHLKKIGTAIVAADFPYQYIAIDTATALEDMCISYAEELYSKAPEGKNWFTEGKAKYGNIISLPNGSGYHWLRTAFDKVIAYIQKLAPRLIIMAHVKDIMLEKAGSDVRVIDIDLTGRIKRIAAANSDAIGYLYRKGNQNILSFKTSDEVACGARPEHLRNKEIVISELTESGVTTNWNEVYID